MDAGYDRIVQAMFDALKQMAKMDGEGEDKGQLNYHVIIIGTFMKYRSTELMSHEICTENMHYFVAEISQIEIGSVAAFLKRAEAIYEENLNAYVKIVLRRPFAKIIVSHGINEVACACSYATLGILRRCRTSPQDDRAIRDCVQQQLLEVFAQEGCKGVQRERRAEAYRRSF